LQVVYKGQNSLKQLGYPELMKFMQTSTKTSTHSHYPLFFSTASKTPTHVLNIRMCSYTN